MESQRAYRVCGRMRLNRKRCTIRRVIQRPRQPLDVATHAEVWALDFMRHRPYGGRPFRPPNTIDKADRCALGIDVSQMLRAIARGGNSTLKLST